MKKIFRANLYFLIILLLEILAPRLILAPIFRILGVRDLRIALAINHFAIFIIPAIIYVIVTKANIKDTFKFNKLHLKDAILVIILAFVCIPIMNFFGLLTGFFFENNVGNMMTSISNSPYIILLLLIAVMPAITEEITLRGIVLSGYDGKSKLKASLMIGLFFGIFHLDAQQFLYAAVLGFILAYVVRVTGTIFSSMIMHFIINGTSVTIQKISTLISSPSIEQAKEISIQSLPMNEKIMLLQGAAVWLIIASIIACLIIRKLQSINDRRNGIAREEELISLRRKEENISNSNESTVAVSNERIINWPFIVAILIYLYFMYNELFRF